jgi:hypothetical protein
MINGKPSVPAPPLSVSTKVTTGTPQLSAAVASLVLAAGTAVTNW